MVRCNVKKIFIILVLLLGITGCNNGCINSIKYKDLNQLIEDKETFILLFNDNSDDGKLLKQTLNSVLEENNLKAYEINPSKLTDSEKEALRPIVSYEDVSIVFIKKGVDSSILSHIDDALTSKNEITARLGDAGFIKTSSEETSK